MVFDLGQSFISLLSPGYVIGGELVLKLLVMMKYLLHSTVLIIDLLRFPLFYLCLLKQVP